MRIISKYYLVKTAERYEEVHMDFALKLLLKGRYCTE